MLLRGSKGRTVVAAPALEDVKFWDPRTSTLVSRATWVGQVMTTPSFNESGCTADFCVSVSAGWQAL